MTLKKKKRSVIIAHQYWGRGGAESAAMWIIEALIHEHKVTIYTAGGFNINELNILAGTRISADDLLVRQAEICSAQPFGILKSIAFMRSLYHVGAEYDLRITASGILPWGRPSLQFLSSVEWNSKLAKAIDPDRKVAARERISKCLIEPISWRKRDMTGDMFVANSSWLKYQCEQFLPAPIQVIHPVLPYLPEPHPKQEREETVLVFGRISPEKRIEDAIQIVELSRTIGFVGSLIIAGPDGASDYASYIRSLARERDWVEILPAQTGLDKVRLLQRAKYGLNTCRIEAFGISTAEMAASGVITLVPGDTGQCEIIMAREQQFASIDDAARKLVTLSNCAFYKQRSHTCSQKVRSRFLVTHFIESVQKISERMLSNA